MGSLLSLVVANFYMEKFEKLVITSALLKLRCWFWYIDDTFVVWSHGEEEFGCFLAHINSFRLQIQFTMEKESDDHLDFLDVLILRRSDGSLRHKEYRMQMHTGRYLHKPSNPYPRQKRPVFKTLVDRAKRTCETRSCGISNSCYKRMVTPSGK